MELKKVERTSVADAVFEQIKQKILAGHWKSGDRIAGENQLARQLGVSRVSVRDAIHRLIGMGVLTARHGDGTYVSDPVAGQMQSRLMQQLLLTNPQLMEVLQFRRMVEVGSAGLAARAATDEDIDQLRALEQAMQQAGEDVTAFAKQDLAYHNAIAVISGNSLLTKVTVVIQDVYSHAMEQTIRLRGVEIGRGNHKAITDAIACHDEPLAEALMREHIQSVIDQLVIQ